MSVSVTIRVLQEPLVRLRTASAIVSKMLQNECLDTKIGVDTAENEPYKVCLIFSKNHLTLERIGA